MLVHSQIFVVYLPREWILVNFIIELIFLAVFALKHALDNQVIGQLFNGLVVLLILLGEGKRCLFECDAFLVFKIRAASSSSLALIPWALLSLTLLTGSLLALSLILRWPVLTSLLISLLSALFL